MGELIEVKRPDGKTCPAYLAEAKGYAEAGVVPAKVTAPLELPVELSEALAGDAAGDAAALTEDIYRLASLELSSPADMAAGLAYAEAAFAAGERDGAADKLLAMIQADRDWNEGAAKARLLQIFEAVGLEDPWVAGQRRRLSLLLFG
mgnify:CR=1 FL=1